MRRSLLAAALLTILPVALSATVIIPIEFRELVTTAPVIVHGRVVDVRAGFVDGRQSVETFVTVAADEYLKGNLGPHVTFKIPGGQLGRYKTIFIGAPEFSEGDEVVLFLTSARSAMPYVIGLNQGAFRVVADVRTGKRMVTTPILMAGPGGGAEAVVRGDVRRQPLAIDAFRDVVRQVLSQGAGQ